MSNDERLGNLSRDLQEEINDLKPQEREEFDNQFPFRARYSPLDAAARTSLRDVIEGRRARDAKEAGVPFVFKSELNTRQ